MASSRASRTGRYTAADWAQVKAETEAVNAAFITRAAGR